MYVSRNRTPRKCRPYSQTGFAVWIRQVGWHSAYLDTIKLSSPVNPTDCYMLHFSAAGCSLQVLTSLSSLALTHKINFSVAFRAQSNRHSLTFLPSQALTNVAKGEEGILFSLCLLTANIQPLCIAGVWEVRHSSCPWLVWSHNLNSHFPQGHCTAVWDGWSWSLQLKLFCFLCKMFGLGHRLD